MATSATGSFRRPGTDLFDVNDDDDSLSPFHISTETERPGEVEPNVVPPESNEYYLDLNSSYGHDDDAFGESIELINTDPLPAFECEDSDEACGAIISFFEMQQDVKQENSYEAHSESPRRVSAYSHATVTPQQKTTDIEKSPRSHSSAPPYCHSKAATHAHEPPTLTPERPRGLAISVGPHHNHHSQHVAPIFRRNSDTMTYSIPSLVQCGTNSTYNSTVVGSSHSYDDCQDGEYYDEDEDDETTSASRCESVHPAHSGSVNQSRVDVTHNDDQNFRTKYQYALKRFMHTMNVSESSRANVMKLRRIFHHVYTPQGGDDKSIISGFRSGRSREFEASRRSLRSSLLRELSQTEGAEHLTQQHGRSKAYAPYHQQR